MNPKLRAFLEQNGLKALATEAEAWAHYDKLIGDGIQFPGIDPGTRSAATGTATGTGTGLATGTLPAAVAPPVDVAALAREAVRADIVRRREIEDRIQIAGLADHDNGNFSRTMLDNPDITVDRAAALIFAELRTRSTVIGSGVHAGQATVGRESREKLRAAITDGLLVRSGHRIATPAEGYREFRGRHMTEICRELLEAAGINTRGMGVRDLVGRAITSGSTSDFPLILGALVNKNLLSAYNEWPSTWRPFCAVGSATDFKLMYSLKLSGAPDLQGLNENGEYKTAQFSDAGESYRVITKGIQVKMTREMIINDDLRAFTRIPQLFGSSAKRMEADAVYSLITTNGNMSDGVPLFHGTHKNLAGTAAAIASDSLGLARSGMRKQTGLNGEPIDIIPAFLLTPVVLETTAEVILRSTSLPTAEMSAGVHNPWQGKLTPVADPHLDTNSLTAWYLFAHPNQAPVIEVAWLEGEEQPYVEEQIEFSSDALVTKVRHDFGAGVSDHVGGYKNAGA